jgi:hypothetical protein
MIDRLASLGQKRGQDSFIQREDVVFFGHAKAQANLSGG